MIVKEQFNRVGMNIFKGNIIKKFVGFFFFFRTVVKLFCVSLELYNFSY